MGFVDTTVKWCIDTRNRKREIEAMTATPGQWAKLMDKAGFTSVRQLARAAGIDHTIINRVITKGTSTSLENMEKVAAALKVPVEQLYEIASGVAATPFTPPKGTEKLSESQKEALAEIIRSMVKGRENAEELVYKKSAEPAQSEQEKTASVTPLRGRSRLTPAQKRFEESGRKVARIKRDIPQDSPKIDTASPDTDQ